MRTRAPASMMNRRCAPPGLPRSGTQADCNHSTAERSCAPRKRQQAGLWRSYSTGIGACSRQQENAAPLSATKATAARSKCCASARTRSALTSFRSGNRNRASAPVTVRRPASGTHGMMQNSSRSSGNSLHRLRTANIGVLLIIGAESTKSPPQPGHEGRRLGEFAIGRTVEHPERVPHPRSTSKISSKLVHSGATSANLGPTYVATYGSMLGKTWPKSSQMRSNLPECAEVGPILAQIVHMSDNIAASWSNSSRDLPMPA